MDFFFAFFFDFFYYSFMCLISKFFFVAPKMAQLGPGIKEAYDDVRNDKTSTNWFVLFFSLFIFIELTFFPFFCYPNNCLLATVVFLACGKFVFIVCLLILCAGRCSSMKARRRLSSRPRATVVSTSWPATLPTTSVRLRSFV